MRTRALIIIFLVACGKTNAAPAPDAGVSVVTAAPKASVDTYAIACADGVSLAPRAGYTSLFLLTQGGCAVHTSGRVACWGPFASSRGPCQAAAWVEGLEGAESIERGVFGTCVRTRAGGLWCWGPSMRVTRQREDAGIRMPITRETERGCEIVPAGKLRCWGSDALGQVDGVSRTEPQLPKIVRERVRAFATGSAHTCAIDEDGGVICWGYGEGGGLGDGEMHEVHCTQKAREAAPGVLRSIERVCDAPEPVFGPRAVAGVAEATAIAAGHSTTCVIARGGVTCWGGAFGPRPNPLGLSDAAEIAGAGGLFCARERSGAVSCFGREASGRLVTAVPRRIADLDHATAIAVGDARACAVVEGGAIRCWGQAIDDFTSADR